MKLYKRNENIRKRNVRKTWDIRWNKILLTFMQTPILKNVFYNIKYFVFKSMTYTIQCINTYIHISLLR